MGDSELATNKRKKFIKMLKILNIGIAIFITVFSSLAFVFLFIKYITSLQIFLVLSPLFMAFFGVCLLAAEFKVRFILKKVPFLQDLLGRGIFYIYLSSVIYYFFITEEDTLLAWVSALGLFASGVLFILLHFGFSKDLNQDVLDAQNDESYKERLV